jgi:large subunit ribosomal protein L18
MPTQKTLRRTKLKMSIRRKISGSAEKPRLSVFRSNIHIYAQLIDDLSGRTLASASTFDLEGQTGPKVDKSKMVGTKLAERAKEAGIEHVVFDRNGYLYHGRVKALAEGAREGGLQF